MSALECKRLIIMLFLDCLCRNL